MIVQVVNNKRILPSSRWSSIRYGLVFLTWAVITWSYYIFSHRVHHHHFQGFDHHNGTHPGKNNNNDSNSNSKNHTYPDDSNSNSTSSNNSNDNHHHHDNEHGRKGSFEKIHDEEDKFFLYGLALPLTLLTVAGLIWNNRKNHHQNPKHRHQHQHHRNISETAGGGQVSVGKWTLIWFVLPLFLVMLDGAWGHGAMGGGNDNHNGGWGDRYVRVCMSLMSPSGYAAAWSLSLFLIPVTRHSPVLDWLRVTPAEALAFHRVSGWVGFWNSVLHGFLHLRHLMDVLNPERVRTRTEQLKMLLIPESWECVGTQDPFSVFVSVFFGRTSPGGEEDDGGDDDDPFGEDEARKQRCWLALVNATGAISVFAYALLALTSLPVVRRYSYRLFYLVHIPAAWTMLLTAIWHYPTCALILIPNILYYVSLNIPTYIHANNNNNNNSPLVLARKIEGGSLELVFAVDPNEHGRHENRFVRLSHPDVSLLSHPFSVFSGPDLVVIGGGNHHETNDGGGIRNTRSILLRSTGAFTENMTKILFPDPPPSTTTATTNNGDGDEEDGDGRPTGLDEALLPPRSCSSWRQQQRWPYGKLRFDSYYAGSYDWVDRSMDSHDVLLLVAGGVGIVPFLEFLPALRKRLDNDDVDTTTTANAGTTTTDGYIPVAGASADGDEDGDDDDHDAVVAGPRRIHLHWYCREVGLAIHVWRTYLGPHARAWQREGRLSIHLHLTSANENDGPNDISELFSGSGTGTGVVETIACHNPAAVAVAARDVPFAQAGTWYGRFLLPGGIMAVGTVLHWWWYKSVTLSETYRYDNLIIRSHAIGFAVLLALWGSVLADRLRRAGGSGREGRALVPGEEEEEHAAATATKTTVFLGEDGATDGSTEDDDDSEDTLSSPTQTPLPLSLLSVSAGRPPLETVIGPVLGAARPGVFTCGPRGLMEGIETAVRTADRNSGSGSTASFYREDSEL